MFRGITLVFILLLTHQAWGMGLGQASLHSHLGEPLDVRVPVLLAQGETLDQFKIQLASPQEYHSLEQMLPSVYATFRVTLQRGSSPEVHIVSSTAVDEAILVLVLKVKKGRGSFYKKMQFFLDAADIQPVSKASWVNQLSQQVQYTPPTKGLMSAPAPLDTSKAPAANYDGGWARRSRYGPVRYGDSLSEIAYRLRKDKRFSNREVMLALFDANPDAFVNQDMNQLKKGQFLNVPDEQAMRGFIQSPRYQALKPLLNTKKKLKKKSKQQDKTEKNSHPKQTEAKKFRGHIALGLTENLVPAPVNPEVLQRLNKLEPMYQQAMATGLRLDGMDTKVDTLAKELGQLRHQVDALSRMQTKPAPEKGSYAWYWFFGLLLLNIVLFAAYFYRKQMKLWQNKLVEARQSMPQPMVDQDIEDVKDEKYAEDLDNQIFTMPEQSEVDSVHDNQAVGLDKYDSMVGDDVSGSYDNQELDVISIDHMPSVPAVEEVKHDYVSLFEEAVHKKDWEQAEEYYALMDDKESSRPRMQALWVEKLHRSNDIMERNLTLLNLSRLYEYDQWHRFCSYFDQDVWHDLQNEKVISYTGKAVESEMDKMNQQLIDREQGSDDVVTVLDLSESGRFDVPLQDSPVDTSDSIGNPMLDTWDKEANAGVDKADQVFAYNSAVDMGRVDADDVEPLADIITDEVEQSVFEGTTGALDIGFDFELETELETDVSQPNIAPMVDEMENGEDDTVMVTPEMLAELEEASAKKNQKSTIDSQQKHQPYPDDKGDTVFVGSQKMKAFRDKLNKLDD